MINKQFEGLSFLPSDILIPQNCDLSLWSVVACDQYTSEPEYWTRVEETVGTAPSTLRLMLPESRLEGENVADDIAHINTVMHQYLTDGQFQSLSNTMIYVERTLRSGLVRRGLVGMVDLEEYDYTPSSNAQIRATEGTVLTRIPPRVSVRRNAPIELPHVMLLTDDPDKTVIEPLINKKDSFTPVYDFALMEQGGHIKGWKLDDDALTAVATALHQLANPDTFNSRYGTTDKSVFLFAAGDGNHSLATAKASYAEQKAITPPDQWATLPSRYALAELVNLHDDALDFEPIHRVVFGVDPATLLADFTNAHTGAFVGTGDGHTIHHIVGNTDGYITVPTPTAQLPVGTLQEFLDGWLTAHPEASIDYIHGEDVTRELSARPDAVGFILPSMEKASLFPTVIFDGVLPRKTFSMGEAHDKRFYLEARLINR